MTWSPIQKRALRIIIPWTSYSEALSIAGLQPLYARRQELTESLFRGIASNKDHKLHKLLPLCNNSDTILRNKHRFNVTFKRACPQKSNILRPRLKIRFCSNFVQVYCIISQNALQSFLSKIYFCFEENAIYIGPPEIR